MPSLRLARRDDAGQIRDIYAPYVTDSFVSFEEQAPTTEEMADRIASTTEQYPWLVCVEDATGTDEDTVLGYAYASQHRGRSAYRWGVDVSVYVAETGRRRGVATGLYTALFDVLRSQNYVNAYAGTAVPNPSSTGFHAAMGFELIGTYEEVGYKHGAWRDVQWWVKRLGARVEDPADPIPVTELVGTDGWRAALATGETQLEE